MESDALPERERERDEKRERGSWEPFLSKKKIFFEGEKKKKGEKNLKDE